MSDKSIRVTAPLAVWGAVLSAAQECRARSKTTVKRRALLQQAEGAIQDAIAEQYNDAVQPQCAHQLPKDGDCPWCEAEATQNRLKRTAAALVEFDRTQPTRDAMRDAAVTDMDALEWEIAEDRAFGELGRAFYLDTHETNPLDNCMRAARSVSWLREMVRKDRVEQR